MSGVDGTLWTEVRHTGLAAPRLLLQRSPDDMCDDFCERATDDFATLRSTSNVQQFSIAGSTHQNFTDFGLMWGPANAPAFGSIDPGRMSALTRDVVVAFLDVSILEAPAATLSEAIARYSEVEAV